MRPVETSMIRTLPLGSDPTLRHRFMVVDEPIRGNLRFGLLLELLDKTAEEIANSYVRRTAPDARVVTAAIDTIVLRSPIDVTRDLIFHARINYVGKTSMEVGIRLDQPGTPVNHVASCYFTMVARTQEEEPKSVELPALEYGDDLEKERAEKAVTSRDDYRRERAAAMEPPSQEEFELLARLHREQERPGFSGFRAGNLVTESWERMYPEQENVPKTIFGGYLIRRAYEISDICAELVAPDRTVLAAVNRINFFHPVRLGDKLHFTSRVVYTEESMVCVEAGIERISRDRTSKALSNSCLFTFVNVDREMNHRPIPPIYPVTYAEDARYLEAARRLRTIGKHL